MPIELWPAYVMRLAAGILAIHSQSEPVSQERATRYAAAAAWHGLSADVDPWELIGIARNESDFVEDQLGPDGKDCGITQTRVTISRYSCNELRRSAWIAFAEAARELSEYNRACRYATDYDRCRLNKYNSGVRYARTGHAGRYWLRVLCYTESARAQVEPGDACRKVTDLAGIARLIEERKGRVARVERAAGKLRVATRSEGRSSL